MSTNTPPTKATLIITAILITTQLQAQTTTIKKGEGTGTHCLSNDISPDQAKQKAILNAKKNAIEKAFGSTLQAEQRLNTNSDRNTSTNKEEIKEYFSKSITEELKGEFVKTPTINCEEKNNCYTCTVSGEMMATNTTLQNNIKWNILNKANALAIKNDFIEGEPLYINFKSSTNGYLSIFFISNDTAYKILPYQNIKSEKYINHMPITQDKEYIFFDIKQNKKNYPDISDEMIDELILTLNKPSDQRNTNNIVIVFDKEPFDKPLLQNNVKDIYIPSLLTEKDFRDWLVQNKLTHKAFIHKESTISIQKNKPLLH